MVILLFRVFIVYFIVLIYLRIMGKRQLGEMQPFELVITLLMADIASLPMTQTSMPLLFSIVPLTALVIVHFFVCFFARKNTFVRRVVNGKPVLVITPQGIQMQALKELNMSLDDLMEGLRGCEYYNIDEVLYAIVETNGTINVLPKKADSQPTVSDMQYQLPENTLPMMLICAGKLKQQNIDVAKFDIDKIKNILKEYDLLIKDVLVFTLDINGQIYIQTVDNKTISKKIDYKGEW